MNAHAGQSSAISFTARSLLAFVLEPSLPLNQWFEALDAWLARSPAFFASKPVILQMAGLEISLLEYRELLGDLARRHIRVMAAENPNRTLVGPHLPPIVSGGRAVSAEKLLDAETPDDEPPAASRAPARTPAPSSSLVVESNVRSGQSIAHLEGDVTIIGRVASGAEIIAGGSVHVYGALQGRVIAGVSGAPNARIFCRAAKAELLCIGGSYVTAEEMDPKIEGRSITVHLDDDELKIRILD
ncbi:MAG: septum site-determining protein MinC [Hyphomicrobiales bacterium]|nr:septum site-determining protein MinC [Hyphomicrobiales bacterium]MBV8663106.1 septum site-determining protein MinC [Hyphomicrobiales bacterium]